MNVVTPPSGFTQSPDASIHRRATAELDFVRGGGRTVLARQIVPYPFHVTRPFQLDPSLPDLATIYLQSASGGLYRGDRLHLNIRAGRDTRAHLTSQAATVVHHTIGDEARLDTTITVKEGAFLALTNDPFILFPDASFATSTDIVLAPGACGLLADGIAIHDPAGDGRPFTRLSTILRVRDETGRLLCLDRGSIEGHHFTGQASPLGRYRAMGTMLLLGQPQLPAESDSLARRLDMAGAGPGACISVSELPNECGLVVRCLAENGGELAQAMDSLFQLLFEIATGYPPAMRRK